MYLFVCTSGNSVADHPLNLRGKKDAILTDLGKAQATFMAYEIFGSLTENFVTWGDMNIDITASIYNRAQHSAFICMNKMATIVGQLVNEHLTSKYFSDETMGKLLTKLHEQRDIRYKRTKKKTIETKDIDFVNPSGRLLKKQRLSPLAK